MKQLRYGLALVAAVGALVAVQVVPKLEDHRLRSGGSPVEGAPGEPVSYAGSQWRLVSLTPATGEKLPRGTSAVTAVIGVTPTDAAAGKVLTKGCEAAVRDAADRSWTPSSAVAALPGIASTCARIDKNYRPIPPPPGQEVRWQASFVVPADAVSSLLIEVRLSRAADFLRLAPAPRSAGTRPPAG